MENARGYLTYRKLHRSFLFAHLPLVHLRGVGQEGGVHVLQVRTTGADRGDAESIAAVPPAPLVRSVVWLVEGLGVRARGAAAAGLSQLATGDEMEQEEESCCYLQIHVAECSVLPSRAAASLTRSSASWFLRFSWPWACCWPTPTEARSHRTGCSCRNRKSGTGSQDGERVHVASY